MRSRPSSWRTTLTKLGFRRVARNHRNGFSGMRAHRRRARVEALEPRWLLAVTTGFVNGELTLTASDSSEQIVLGVDVNGFVTNNGNQLPGQISASTVTRIEAYGSEQGNTIDLSAVTDDVFSALSLGILIEGYANDPSTQADATDTIFGSPDFANTIDGGEGDDIITGGDAGDTIIGGNGIDLIVGGAGDDTIAGNDRDDIIDGGDGSDFIDGGNGNDQLTGGGGDDDLTGGSGIDVLNGGGGDDTLTGGNSDDQYIFSGQLDLGSDTIVESSAASTADTLDFSQLDFGVGVVVDLTVDSTAQQVVNQGGQQLTLFLSNAIAIENVIGTPLADTLTANQVANRLDGGDGNDTYRYSSLSMGTWINQEDVIVEPDANGVDTLDFSNLFSLEDSNGVTVDLDSVSQYTNIYTHGTLGIRLDFSNLPELENVIGSARNDSLIGNSLDNRLAGGPGDDTYRYWEDSDAGSDAIVELVGEGVDTIDFSWLDFGTGVTLDLGLSAPQEVVNAGGEQIEVDLSEAALENIYGTDFDDVLTGNADNNFLDGRAGNDIIIGGVGNDHLIGQAGTDILDGGSGDDLLDGGTGDDALDGGAGIDNLSGDIGNDSLSGGAGDDTLVGGTGSDQYLFSGIIDLGSDTVIEAGSSSGTDTLDFSQLDFGIGIDVDLTLDDTPQLVIDDNGRQLSLTLDDATAIESLVGTAYNDLVTANTTNSLLDGRAGNDTYRFGADSIGGNHTIIESSGNGIDTLDFSTMLTADDSPGVDVDLGSIHSQHVVHGGLRLNLSGAPELENVIGSARNDTLVAGALNNRLEGGLGDDSYVFSGNVDLGTNTIVELADEGTDTLDFSALDFGGGIDLNLKTTASQEIINVGGESIGIQFTNLQLENVNGTDFDDVFNGNKRPNLIDGRGGDDTIDGGEGDDTIYGGLDADTIDGGEGDDTIFGADGNDTIDGGEGDDTLWGEAGDDSLRGGKDDDTLLGGSGDDLLQGDDGDDHLDGGYGNDRYLFAGQGNQGADSIIETSSDTDTIDFSALDIGVGIDIDLTLDDTEQTVADNGQQSLKLTLDDGDLIENVIGTSYGDTITANTLSNRLEGLAGDDTYRFGPDSIGGTDTIVEAADDGNDTLDFSMMLSADNSPGIDLNLASGSAFYSVYGGLRLNQSDSPELENVIGSDRDDALRGNSLDNRLEGGLGDDTYIFAGTTDTGLDTITELAGEGSDTIDFSSLDFGVGVSFDLRASGTDYEVDDAGGKRVRLNLTNTELENVTGTAYDDTLTSGPLDNRIAGGWGNDRYIFAGTADLGSDTIVESSGSGGTDTLDFGQLDFGIGVDVNLQTNDMTQQVINDGSRQLTLTLDNATLLENIIGTPHDDMLTGNAGDNELTGGLGADALLGYGGNDSYRFHSQAEFDTDTITESAGQGNDTADFSTVAIGVSVDLSTLPSVENIIGTEHDDAFSDISIGRTIVGSDGDDFYHFTGGVVAVDAVFEESGGGTDTLDFSAMSSGVSFDLTQTPHVENMIGTPFDDTLIGNELSNMILGGLGDDVYKFVGTIDPLQDFVFEFSNGGSDTLDFSGLSNPVTIDLQTMPQIENVVGTPFDDTITGNAADNRLEGGTGADSLTGGLGNDTYVFSGTDDYSIDTLLEVDGEGTDALDFAALSNPIVVDLQSLPNFENVVGSPFADSIFGNASDNYLDGGADADTVEGRDGNDIVVAGFLDTLAGGAGDDSYRFVGSGDPSNVSITEDPGDGADTLDFSLRDFGIVVDLQSHPEIENVLGTPFDDTIVTGSSANTLTGGTGDDTYRFVDTAYPAANTIIEELAGGIDTIDFSTATNAVTVDLQSFANVEDVVGSPFDDSIAGNAANNELDGGGGADTIDGREGDDIFIAGPQDLLSGGTGDDVYKFTGTVDPASLTVDEQPSGGIDRLDFSAASAPIDIDLQLFDHVEDVVGSPFADVITGNSLPNMLAGGLGDDTYRFAAGGDPAVDNISEETEGGFDQLDYSGLGSPALVDLMLMPYIEAVIGTPFGDTIIGNDLDNHLEGGGGADSISGGLGDDTYAFTGTDDWQIDTLVEADDEGTDTLDFSGRDSAIAVDLQPVAQIENVVGSGFDDTIFGNGLENRLDGGGGADLVEGRDGSDRLIGGSGDTLAGGTGNDTYEFIGSVDHASLSIVELHANGVDHLDFSQLSNAVVVDLQTFSNVESVVGTAFDDEITAGAAPNTLNGGLGNDTYKYVGGSDPAVDTIVEAVGQGIDTLDFSGRNSAITIDLQGYPYVEDVVGTPYDATITGSSAANRLSGGPGMDWIAGGYGSDIYVFTGSDDPASDTLVEFAGEGSDWLDFSGMDGGVTVDLRTQSEIENVTGSSFDDVVTTGSSVNYLSGGEGDDRYIFAANSDVGVDTIVESISLGGTDTVDLSQLTAGVVFDLRTATGIEDVIGTAFDDTITANGMPNTIAGGDGNDTYRYLYSDTPQDDTIVEQAGGGVDTLDLSGMTIGIAYDLNNSANIEHALGTALEDTFIISEWILSLAGGNGDDAYQFVGSTAPAIGAIVEFADGGIDEVDLSGLDSGAVADLQVTPEIENVTGTPFADTITGNDLNNRLQGGGGVDTITGGFGDDTYVYIGSDDIVADTLTESSGEGTDMLDFSGLSSSVTVDLRDHSNVENVIGTSLADTITGNANDNHLIGGAGDDWIEGREGIDLLEGGSDTDTYSLIAGETLGVTDIVVDEDAYNVQFPGGSTVAAPFVELVMAIAPDGSGIILATVSDADTPLGDLTIDVTGIDPADITATPTGEIVWTVDLATLVDPPVIDITVTDDTGVAASRTIPAGSYEDTDDDGLLDLHEDYLGTDPGSFDSDGDLLGDGFELTGGLDPSDSDEDGNGVRDDQDDFDNDGLNNLSEAIYQSHPTTEDSDGDGTTDGDEVDQGSNPTDASDNGLPPDDDNVARIELNVGDDSGSHSERWELVVGDIAHQSPSFGVLSGWVEYIFEKGESYSVTLNHRGSNISPPDYDWYGDIRSASGTTGISIIENPAFSGDNGATLRLIGFPNDSQHEGYQYPGPNYASGQVATLHIPKVDLDLLDAGLSEIPDEDEEDPGGYMMLNNDDDDEDGIIDSEDSHIDGGTSGTGDDDFTQMTLHKLVPDALAQLAGSFKLTFDSSRVRIWKDPYKDEEVYSDSTELEIDTDHTLYIEGLMISDSPRDVEIKATYEPDSLGSDYTVSGDKAEDIVKVTIIGLDLDIDSDNSGQLAAPSGSDAEDEIEWKPAGEISSSPGKVILVASGDADDDDIPDLWDGFDADGVPSDDDHSPTQFVPLDLSLPHHVDISSASTLTINYDENIPGNAGGYLRIWTEDGNVERDKRDIRIEDDGDFVGPGEYTRDRFALVGLTESDRQQRLFVEAFGHSTEIRDLEITVTFDNDGMVFEDKVQLTAIEAIDLQLDNISDQWEEEPGAIVWLNSDFSKQVPDPDDPDEPGLPRYLPDHEAEAQGVGHLIDPEFADDFTQASLYFPSLENGIFEFDFLDSRLELWTQADWDGFESAGDGWYNIRPAVEVTPLAETLDFWIEGTDASGSGFGIHDIRVENKTPGWSSVYAAAAPWGNGAIEDTTNYTVVDTTIAVDGNRDGNVEHTNSHDRQLTFWYNNDREHEYKGSLADPLQYLYPDFETDDTELTAGEEIDFVGGQIKLRRDLEDFAHLQLAISQALRNTTYVVDTESGQQATEEQIKVTYSISYEDAAADSSINLYVSETTDPYAHVRDDAVASAIMDQQHLKTAYHAQIDAQPNAKLNLSVNQGPTEGTYPYLFEAFGTDHEQAKLVFTAKVEYPDESTSERRIDVDLDLRDFSQFYDRYRVSTLELLDTDFDTFEEAHLGDATRTSTSLVHGSPFFAKEENVVLVHGWNMEDIDKQVFAQTAFKRLYWQGYAGRMLAFDWPTYVDGDSGLWPQALTPADLTFNASEFQAFRSGRSLRNLLSGLSGEKTLLAHSMGNVVAAEALRLSSSQLVNTYVAMQGAISAGVYNDNTTGGRDATGDPWDTDLYRYWSSGQLDPGDPDSGYMAGSETAAAKWVNLYNPSDFATAEAWPINNENKDTLELFESFVWPYGYREDLEALPGGSKEYVRLTPNILNPDPPIETPLVDGLVDAAGNPAEHAYEIIAFMAQSNAMPIGTKEVDWFDLYGDNKNLEELGLDPFNDESPLHVGTRGNHSFQFHHDGVATWQFWEYVKQQSGFDATY